MLKTRRKKRKKYKTKKTNKQTKKTSSVLKPYIEVVTLPSKLQKNVFGAKILKILDSVF